MLYRNRFQSSPIAPFLAHCSELGEKLSRLSYSRFGFLSLLLLGGLLLGPQELSATHIVGGEVTYRCLGPNESGNNDFEISLTVYRDCFNGSPQAPFDPFASIGIFDSDNQLVTSLGDGTGQLLIPFVSDDTLNPSLNNPCFVIPPNVCVHTTTYRDTLELPFRIGGYLLAYQRCCRNVTIQNIVNPLNTGATYSVLITERALLECNSSATFINWPPNYICANEPIDFDHSAIDIDGDSLVYKLCVPLDGATFDEPMPQPPLNPPYQEVVWVDPPYDVNNMLNAAPGEPLRINSASGFLTGLPNTLGQFVVGICLEEYRDGELISTTRRDFQYNVGPCGQTVSAFFTPELQCTGTEVSFDNFSQNATTFAWYFNDPGNPGAFSMESEPTYTYADTGRYTVMLVANPGEACTDTSFQEVYLQFASLTANFDYSFVECSDSMIIQVTDASVDSISEITSWEWTLSSGVNTLGTSTEQNPSFVVFGSRLVNLSLIVTAENGCVQELSEFFEVELIEVILPPDSLLLCRGDSLVLNPNPELQYSY
ncbi:MAG: PKD domain-containing protein, partial [Bacteroidota bacterium]